jgi:predicted nucleic acid-binding protein
MGLINSISKGETVFIDTAPFVYFVEKQMPYVDLLRPLFNTIDAGEIRALTTTITYSETLVIPCRRHDRALIAHYETLLTETPSLTIVPFDLILARKVAEIRSEFPIKTPDAIQWATAVRHNVQYFLTNDKGFKKLTGLKILLLDDFVR